MSDYEATVPMIAYMTPRGAGIVKTCRTEAEAIRILKREAKAKRHSNLMLGAERVGGSEEWEEWVWWYDPTVFEAESK